LNAGEAAKQLWVNAEIKRRASGMHPVMSASGKVVYWVSEDRTTLSFDAGDAFGERKNRQPRACKNERRTSSEAFRGRCLH
jgi:hypothetical protein